MNNLIGFFLNLFSIPIPNVMHYYTFRFGFALVFSLFLSLILMPYFIEYIRKLYPAGQPIRDLEKLKNHNEKKNNVTMGGLIIVFSVILSIFMIGNLKNKHLIICLFSFLSFSFIGFLDDILKIKKRYVNFKSLFFINYKLKTNELGISPKIKSSLQVLFALFTVISFNCLNNNEYYTSYLTFPFFRKLFLNLSIIYTIFRIITIVGTSNAINITDGLDGLVIVPTIFNFITFALFLYLGSNLKYANYLFLFYQPDIVEVFIMCGAVIGGSIGFLWYNIKPAQIFMGDVGSLGLGGLLGSIAVMTKNELLLLITGGLFVIEALSVIIQVSYFKMTKGKRIFKMAPIHHHFEIKGWSEIQVVVRFWIISLVFILIGISSLKLR